MGYEPKTPFGRPAEMYHVAAVLHADETASKPVDKWHALAELSEARTELGLSNRELGTLRGLLSFHPETILCENGSIPVVYPSNRALAERLNGMPLSTLRRHLAALVKTGIIIRRDSPNGKRYVRRGAGDQMVFGFDLSPLSTRFDEFCTIAHRLRARRHRLTRLRQEVSLMRRDLCGLAALAKAERPDLEIWHELSIIAATASRDLRRTLSEQELSVIKTVLLDGLEQARSALGEVRDTTEMAGIESQNERHHQNSNKEHIEFEKQTAGSKSRQDGANIKSLEDDHARPLPSMPLDIVLKACRQIAVFTLSPIRHWHDLFNAADNIAPSTGINQSTWRNAVKVLGPEEAAIVVCAILERFDDIRSPGAYLRALTRKASAKAFSSGPMILALLRRQGDRVASPCP